MSVRHLALNKTRILNAGLAQRQSATLVKWMSRFQNSYPAPLKRNFQKLLTNRIEYDILNLKLKERGL